MRWRAGPYTISGGQVAEAATAHPNRKPGSVRCRAPRLNPLGRPSPAPIVQCRCGGARRAGRAGAGGEGAGPGMKKPAGAGFYQCFPEAARIGAKYC